MNGADPPDARQDFRNREFDLNGNHASSVAGLVETLEPAEPWKHARPAFICNLSEDDIPDWIVERQNRPARYLCRHRDSLVFAQNYMVEKDGAWSCESQTFRFQLLMASQSPAYCKIYAGGRLPEMRFGTDKCMLSTSNLSDGDISHIPEPVFLASSLEPDNWGRWVATVIPKAAYFVRNASHRQFFCRAAKPWQREILKTLGIPEDRLLNHNPGATYVCDDLETIRYSATSMVLPNCDRAVWQDLAERYGKRMSPEKIFVSRLSASNKRPHYRRLINEIELIHALTARGYRVIEPELLCFEDQIAMFANAKCVVGLGGAAMYNVAFCRPGTPVVTIESGLGFVKPHSTVFASLGHPYGVVFGQQDTTDLALNHRRWSLDVPVAIKAVEAFLG